MTTQISARISNETKAQIDAVAHRRGIAKARLIEEALEYYLLALHEIPDDIAVPSRLVVSAESMEQVAARLNANQAPTAALRALMRDQPR